MKRGPPYPAYPGSTQQQPQPPPHSDWGSYYSPQPGQRPPAPPTVSAPPLPQQPPAPPNPEHASLYANYGYGNRWRALPPQPQPQPQPPQPPPQPQYIAMQPNPVFAPPSYPVGYHPAHPAMPMMYMQPGHQPMIPSHPHPTPMHMPQPPHNHPQPNLAPPLPPQQFYPAQGGHQNNNSNNTQRFPPPAKRPRFDNNRPTGPGTTPSSSFNSNTGPGPSNSGPPRQPEPPTVGPPPHPHPPLPPPPQQTHGQQQNVQTHGRFPPQQPAFKGRGGGPLSSSRGRGSSRGSTTGRGGSVNSGAGRGAGGRGGSHGPSRGSFRAAQNLPHKSSNNSQPAASSISASSFNPQLPNGQSFTSFSSNRSGRHQQNFAYGRDGTPRREDSGTKKTLTDFRIIGVVCPTLKWSWGIIPTPAVKDIPEDGDVQEESTRGALDIDLIAKPSDGETARTPKLPSSQLSDSETVTSTPTTAGPSHQTSAPSVTETLLATPQKTHPLPQTASSSACATSRAPTETSRIRLYFNSPVELEDRPALHVAPVDQPNQHQRRGGKRKKEQEEGEPEEGSKRKKEDNDSTNHRTHSVPPQPSNESVVEAFDRAPNGDAHPRNEATLEPSGIGAKRKAPSLSGDEEDGDSTHQHDRDRLLIIQNEQPKTDEPSHLEAEHDAETEYAGSPPHDVFLEYPEPPHSVFSTVEGEGDEEIISASQAPTEIADPDPHEQPDYASESDAPEAPHEDNAPAAPEIEGNMPVNSDVQSHDESGAQLCGGSLRAVDRACNLNQDGRKTTGSSPPVHTTSASTDAPIAHQPVNPDLTVAPAATAPVGQTPSPNRISISYAGSSRRLVLDAEVVQRVKIFRTEGRIEVRFVLEHVKSSPSFSTPAPCPVSSAKLDLVASSTDQDSASEPAVQPRPLVAKDIGLAEGCTGNDSAGASVVASESISLESSTDANVGHFNGVVESSSARRPANVPASPRSALQSTESCLQPHTGMVRCRGILVEALSEITSDYVPATYTTDDATLPDFVSLLHQSTQPPIVDLIAYLDHNKPLSEPKWVRTGDVEDLLHSVFAKNLRDRAAWANKVEVVDPDPPPTIHSVLESWTTSSNMGHGKDRRRFVKEYISNASEHILEIVLRQVRGAAQQHSTSLAATSSLPALSLLSSPATLPSNVSFWQSAPNAPHAAQHAQAPVSAALLGLWQMATEFAERAGEQRAKVEDRLGNLVVRSLPQNLISKSLDAMFRDWTSSVGLPLPNVPVRKK